MKVVHISYSTSGGAGIAAYRLHKSMLNNGINSRFLCLKSKQLSDTSVSVIGYKRPSLIQRFFNKFFTSRVSDENKRNLNKLVGTYEIFSFPTSDYRIEHHALLKDADIINFHWIGDFVNLPSFLNKIKKPIIWTLHDQNPFRGGFHYELDFDKNKLSFNIVENKLKSIKQLAYKRSTIYAIVAPSLWMSNLAKKSELLNQFRHIHIYNNLDINIFKLQSKQDVRLKLNIDDKTKVFCFVSQQINNLRKGFDLLVPLFEKYKNRDILFLAIGNSENSLYYENVRYLGSVINAREMAEIYNASNAFLLPSREDNLPNTMIEALSTGTPVIGSAVGGIKDEIEHLINGILVEDEDFESAIDLFLSEEESFNQEIISKEAHKKYNSDVIVNNYLMLYESLLIK